MSDYYDRNGHPISLDEFVRLWAEDSSRCVARTERDGITVSTVWLGLDHQWGSGPPLIFETMIFGGEHDSDQYRYSTESQALAGHEKACRIAFGEEAE